MKTEQNLPNGCNISSICCKNFIVWSFLLYWHRCRYIILFRPRHQSYRTMCGILWWSVQCYSDDITNPLSLIVWWAHRFRKWLVAYSTASHYLNQRLVNWTDRQKFSYFLVLVFVCLIVCFILSKYKNKNSSTKIHLMMSPAKWRPFWSMARWFKMGKWKEF